MYKKIIIIFILLVIPLIASANEKAEFVLEELGVGPDGRCTTVEECRKFCSKSDENRLICLEFAREHGLIDDTRYERVQRALTVKPEGPNGCRGLACRKECRLEENYEICLTYIEDNNLTVPERVEHIKLLRERLDEHRKLKISDVPTRAILPRVDDMKIDDQFFQERLRYQDTLERIESTREKKQPEPTHNFQDTIERNMETDFKQLDKKRPNSLNRLGGFISNAIKSFFD
jgi:hypothetical protein